MKKLYAAPQFTQLTFETKDVITVSAGSSSGSIQSYSFRDILNGTAGWLES